MHPIVALPGGGSIQAVTLAMALAVLVGLLGIPWWAARAAGVPLSRALLASILLALGALVGARLHFLLNSWAAYRGDWLAVLKPWGAMHAAGGILGMLAASVIVLPRLRIPVRRFLDASIPLIAISMAIGRLGCVFHGCCYGTQCSYPWCLVYPVSSPLFALQVQDRVIPPDAMGSLPVHPLPIYFAVMALLQGAFALWLLPRKAYDGQVALVSGVLLSLTLALFEPLRGNFPERVFWGGLPQLEWAALAMAVVSLAAWLACERRWRAARPSSPRPSSVTPDL